MKKPKSTEPSLGIDDFVTFNFTNASLEIQQLEKFRAISDGIGIIYYIFAYSFIGLLFIFDPLYQNTNDFYSNFDFRSIFFILLFFFTIKNVRFYQVELKYYLSHFLEALIISFGLFFILYGLWESIIFNLFSVIQIPKASILTYQFVTTIPLEEMIFRGLYMNLIVLLLTKVFRLNIEEKNAKTKYYLAWIITTIFTGILFGLFHLPKYTTSFYPNYLLGADALFYYVLPIFVPILYLSLLGIILGYIRFKYGLAFALLIHVLNNFIANLSGFVFPFLF